MAPNPRLLIIEDDWLVAFGMRDMLRSADIDVVGVAIRDLLGHTTIDMTMRYAHLAPSRLHEVVAMLPPVGRQGWATGGQSPACRPSDEA